MLKGLGFKGRGCIRAFSNSFWTDWQNRIQKVGPRVFTESFRFPEKENEMKSFLQAVARMKGNVADFVPSVVIDSLCAAYRGLDFTAKTKFLLSLARNLHADEQQVHKSLEAFSRRQIDVVKSNSIQWDSTDLDGFLKSHDRLRNALSPVYEILFRQIIAQKRDGMLFLVHIREDLLKVLRKKLATTQELIALQDLDRNLKGILTDWFGVGFLQLERITYESTPGSLLEKIIRYEAVHPVGTIVELKRRLGTQ